MVNPALVEAEVL